MIENFQISNFKGFNEPLKIDIAPITLIFGPNSSGKSSVINSLEMIKYSGPNTLQSYIENLLDLGKTEDIISRQNKNKNKHISYSFSFKYSDFDKPKGPTISNASKVKIKKEFKLNKDNYFDLNSISFFIEDNFLFSLDINRKNETPNNYSATIKRFSKDYDFLKTIFKSNYFDEDNFFLKNARKIDFIINQRSKDRKLQNNLISSSREKVQSFETSSDNIKEFTSLYLNFKKTNNTEKIIKFLKSKDNFYNFEIYLIEFLLKNRRVKTEVIEELFKTAYKEDVEEIYGDQVHQALLTFVVGYLNEKLQKIFNLTDSDYGFIAFVDIPDNYLEWIEVDLENTILKIQTEELKKISEEIDKNDTFFKDEYKNFSTEHLSNILKIFTELSDMFRKVSLNKFKTDWKNFEKKFYDYIIDDLKNNFLLKIELGYTYGSSKAKAVFERNKDTLIDYLNINNDNFFSNIEDLIDHCDSLIDESLNNFTFIPCIRNYERIYRSTQKNFRSLNDISRSTSDLVDALIEDKELLQDVNEWLKSSAFNSEIYIEKNSDTKIMYVIERETGVKINIVDAGSGIRNLIPIITVVILSEKNQKNNNLKKFSSTMTPGAIIALEEPEVNLHPKLQIDLTSFITKFSNNKKFLIETHSELMMRKCQQLIRKGELNKDHVRVYCVRKNKVGHYVDEIRLDKSGNFRDEWPHGFFKERMDLLD